MAAYGENLMATDRANRTRVARRAKGRAIDAARRGESHTPRAARREVCVLPRCCQVGEIRSTHPGQGVSVAMRFSP
jgi:hypothetical protein